MPPTTNIWQVIGVGIAAVGMLNGLFLFAVRSMISSAITEAIKTLDGRYVRQDIYAQRLEILQTEIKRIELSLAVTDKYAHESFHTLNAKITELQFGTLLEALKEFAAIHKETLAEIREIVRKRD